MIVKSKVYIETVIVKNSTFHVEIEDRYITPSKWS